MTAQADDGIIKRKLLIEGESGIDDRRFALLLKDYLRWATSEDAGDGSAYQAVIEKIFQCENAMEQAFLIQQMNLEQSNRYTDLLKEIGKSIEETEIAIKKERERLKEARVIRKNRQEYHNLAKVVQEYQERQETLKKIQKMKAELNNLQNIDKLYDEKISLRKKQFHLFVVVLRDLQKMIEQDTPIPEPSDQKFANIESPMDIS
ncbi:hypothetical protein Aperf_G00000094138 [Anoplocephala perfoliata]